MKTLLWLLGVAIVCAILVFLCSKPQSLKDRDE